MSFIAIVILAAGASARMDAPKQLVSHHGRILVRHAVGATLASTCRPVVIVLGANAEQIRPEVEGLPVQISQNRTGPKDWAPPSAPGSKHWRRRILPRRWC